MLTYFCVKKKKLFNAVTGCIFKVAKCSALFPPLENPHIEEARQECMLSTDNTVSSKIVVGHLPFYHLISYILEQQ